MIMKSEAEVEEMVEANEWIRAGGECICPVCGKLYIRHPNCKGKYGWLTELCNGMLVKL
jgi:hypothetical protein